MGDGVSGEVKGLGERYEARIARAVSFIDNNPEEPVSLARLASIACLSPFHFHRVFKSLTGLSVRGYVERRKLEQAIILAGKGHSWKSAAGLSGFRSSIAFTRSFKRVFGQPPSKFDRGAWSKNRPDRDDALSVSSYFLRPAPPLSPDFTVNIVERPAARLAVSRVWGGYLHPERLVRAYERLRNWARDAGVEAGGGKIAGASRDDPDLTPLSRCRYDFALELPAGIAPPSCFSTTLRRAGLWATIAVSGGFDEVDRAWSMLFKSWLPVSGLDLRDEPAEEIYLQLPEVVGWNRFDLLCCVPVSNPKG